MIPMIFLAPPWIRPWVILAKHLHKCAGAGTGPWVFHRTNFRKHPSSGSKVKANNVLLYVYMH